MRTPWLRSISLLLLLVVAGVSCVEGERDGAVTDPGGVPDGAVDGDILQWDDIAKEWAVNPAPGGTGTVTSVDVAEGLETTSGLPVTATGTIRIADGGVSTGKLADGAVTAPKLHQMGATSGQVLEWNGTAWAPAADDGQSYTAGTGIDITTGTISVADGGVTAAKLNQMGAAADQVLVWDGAAWTPGGVTSSVIGDGEIVDADISATAAIDPTKISGTAWTAANDGSLSGLDADTVDGAHKADLLDKATYDAADDGVVDSAAFAATAGDADTVDGAHKTDLLDKATYDAGGVAGVVDLAETATTAGDADTLDTMDSTDFAVLDGQALGQELHGGTGSGETLTLRGTFAGDGDVIIADDTGFVAVGAVAPVSKLHVDGTVTATGFSGDGSALTDVDAVSLQGRAVDSGIVPADGQALKWNAAQSRWEPQNDAGSGGAVAGTGTADRVSAWQDANTLRDSSLYDDGAGHVGVGAAATTEALEVTGNVTATGTVTATTFSGGGLDADDLTDNSVADLSDVDTTGLVADDILRWNGTTWVRSTDAVDDLDADPANETNTSMGWNDATDTVSVTDVSGTQSVVISGFADDTHSHTLGGDVTGDVGATTVARLQGRDVSAAAPGSNQVLKWNGSAWAPGADEGGAGSGWSVTGNDISPTDVLGTTAGNANPLNIMTDGATRMTVLSTGEVGVGTGTPSTALEVAGTVTATGLRVTTTPTAGHVLTSDGSGNATWQAAPGSSGWETSGNALSGGEFLGTTNLTDLDIQTNGTSRMVVLSTGEVGIGTAAPSTTLEVNGTVTATALAGDGTNVGNVNAETLDMMDSSDFVTVAGDSMTGNLDMGLNTVTNLAVPSAASDAVTKDYVDTNFMALTADSWVDTAGDSMTGDLDMGLNTVTNLSAPTAATDAATKGYVDGTFMLATADSWVDVTGDTMTGALTMQEMSEPALSTATDGVLYFDQGVGRFRVSEAGGAYQTLGTGTVTSVATGNGLTGGPITGTGTVGLNLDPAGGLSDTINTNQLGVAHGTAAGQVLKWDGAQWGPGADEGGAGSGWSTSGNAVTGIEWLGTTAGSGHPLDIRTEGTNRITILPTGEVGIGTAAPAQPLEVAGNIYAAGGTGSLQADNDVVAGNQIVSTRTDGAGAPIAVTSTDWVQNLNADMLDGSHASDFAASSHAATHEAGGADALTWTTIHGSGLLGDRPTAGAMNAGYLYLATDDDGGTLYRSDGAGTWTQLAKGVAEAPAAHTHDHSAITNCAVGDDHTQYALLAGRDGEQTLNGGANASGDLTLDSTADGTKGTVSINTGGGDIQMGPASHRVSMDGSRIRIDSPKVTVDLREDGQPAENGLWRISGDNQVLRFVKNTAAAGDFSTITTALAIDAEGEVAVGSLAASNTLTVAGDADVTGSLGVGTASPATTLDVNGTVTATGLRLLTGPTVGHVLTSDASGNATWQEAPGATAWKIAGNDNITDATTEWLGTTAVSGQPLDLRANGQRAMRLEYSATSPNVIAGYSGNSVTAGVYGATIGGGGVSMSTHVVRDHYGTVGGGQENYVGNGTGGLDDAKWATISGGWGNRATGEATFVGGGVSNDATGGRSAVVGGQGHTASQWYAFVGGGFTNTASGQTSTVAGGNSNVANGQYAAIPGGFQNQAGGQSSFAAGNRAKANANGVFAWADSVSKDFTAATANEFAARATAGFRLVTQVDGATGTPWSGLQITGVDPDGSYGVTRIATIESDHLHFAPNGIDRVIINASDGTLNAKTHLVVEGPTRLGHTLNAPGWNVVGTAAATGHGLTDANDLQVTSDLEVDGGLYADGSATVAADLTVDTDTLVVDSATDSVGVGTTLPEAPLHVEHSSIGYGIIVRNVNDIAGLGSSVMTTQKARSTGTGAVVSGDVLGGVTAQGYDGASFIGAAAVVGAATSDFEFADPAGALLLMTRGTGDTKLEERARVTSEGQVGIGTATPSAPLEVSDFMRITPRFGAPFALQGNIYYEQGTNTLRYYDGGDWRDVATSGGGSWDLGGNAITDASTEWLGTTAGSAQPLDMYANGARAMRLEYSVTSPSIIGGHADNSVNAGAHGCTIAGGGMSGPNYNRVTDSMGTVCGGGDNQAGDGDANVNSVQYAAVVGGHNNTASGTGAFVGGGDTNIASGTRSVVAGGDGNTAGGDRATVCGGYSNEAAGTYAVVPGGYSNSAGGSGAFAGGRYANAAHDGAFVWADSKTAAQYSSTAADQFLIKAAGGVGIGTNAPAAPLHVAGNTIVDGRLNVGTDTADNDDEIAMDDGTKLLRWDDPQDAFTMNDDLIITHGNTGSSILTLNGTGAQYLDYHDTTNGIDIQLGGNTSWGRIGTTSGHDFAVMTGGADRIRVSSGGNVGIGTISPAAPLHVQGTADTTLRVETTSSAGNLANVQLVRANTSDFTGLGFNTKSVGDDWHITVADAAGNLTIEDGTPSPALTVEAGSLEVGIGTTTPGADLHIYRNGTDAQIAVTTEGAGSPSLKINRGSIVGNTAGIEISNGSADGSAGSHMWEIGMGPGEEGLCVLADGIVAMDIDEATRNVGIGDGFTANARLHAVDETGLQGGYGDVLILGRGTSHMSGTIAGFGGGVAIELDNETRNSFRAAEIAAFVNSPSSGLESSSLVLRTADEGAVEDRVIVTPKGEVIITDENNVLNDGANLVFQTADTAGDTPTGDSLGGVWAQGFVAGTPEDGAGIAFLADADWAAGSFPTRISFMTDNGTGLQDRLQILSDGNVGIGTTTPSHKLDVNGSARATVGYIGELWMSEGGSDYTIKETGGTLTMRTDDGNAMSLYGNQGIALDVGSGNVHVVDNTFSIGNDADGDIATNNKDIIAEIGSATEPRLRYDVFANQWEFSNDGVVFTPIGGGTGGGWNNSVPGIVRLANITDDVGIGTLTPASPLEVEYNNIDSATAAISIDNTASAGGPQDVLDFKFLGATQARIRKASGGDMFIESNSGLNLNAGNQRALKLEYSATSPNVIGGHGANSVTGGVYGATISGGGTQVNPNSVTASSGTVGGGLGNQSAHEAFVGGGSGNTAGGNTSFVGGGQYNSSGGDHSAIGGGFSNQTQGNLSTIAGGYYNLAAGAYSTIAGGGPSNTGDVTGTRNAAYDDYCTVGGGGYNRAGVTGDTTTEVYATVSGGMANVAQAKYATVGGGGPSDDSNQSMIDAWRNAAYGEYSTVGGGGGNKSGVNGSPAIYYTTIAGGHNNSATASFATVAGGSQHSASGNYAAVGGGYVNVASGTAAFIGSGYTNTASGNWSVVGGGETNRAIGFYSVVSGGGPASGFGNSDTNFAYDDYCVVGGGANNKAGNPDLPTDTATYGTVGGGEQNTASGQHATIGGGQGNLAEHLSGTVAGGSSNSVGSGSSVGGGSSNAAMGSEATIGGGYDNTANGMWATIGGGRQNATSQTYATVGGGYYNAAQAQYATIAGGGPSDGTINTRNIVYDAYGTVGGGGNNRAGDSSATVASYATVGGGNGNTAIGSYSTVAGGDINSTTGSRTAIGGGRANATWDDYSTIGGGNLNTAGLDDGNTTLQDFATVGGGYGNTASGTYATVGGGSQNEATQDSATVGGGFINDATGYRSTVAGGSSNVADGAYSAVGGGYSNYATGARATIAGGSQNYAGGSYSFAAGANARVRSGDDGTFVWADSNGNSPVDFESTGTDQFLIRAGGGVGINTNAPATALDVNGTVTASAYAMPVTTRYYTIHGSEFHGNLPYTTSIYTDLDGVTGADTNTNYDLYAALHLPHGATIKSVSVSFTDNTANDVDLWLWKLDNNHNPTAIDLAPGDANDYSIITSVGASALPRTVTATAPGDFVEYTVDNVNEAYAVNVAFRSSTMIMDMAVHKVTVAYEITEPLP